MSVLVDLKNISKSFPGVNALSGVNFDIRKGEVHALIGENGAGKSTLIKVIAGVHDFSGEYFFDGQKVNFTKPVEAIEAGIRVIYQELNLCETVSIAENIFMGRLPVGGGGMVLDKKKLYADAKKYLDEIGLPVSPKTTLEKLPTSQKQMVEIAKAISTNAKLIIMDEPTSSLSNREIERLFGIIENLKQKGISIVYVSHKLEEIFRISDRVTVLRDGKYIATRKTSEVTQDELVKMMVGREFESLYTRQCNVPGKIVLEATGITTDKLKNVSFQVKAGEIVGFSGLLGAGRTELAKAIFGFDKRNQGKVLVDGVEVKPNKTHIAKKMGLGYVSEDRKKEGILPDLNVKENISVTILNALKKGLFIDNRLETAKAKEMVEKIRIKTPSLTVSPSKLSGGNQQKVIVARWLLDEHVKVLIVDEPTRGIDVGAKTEIYAILDKLAQAGLAIIIMSSEMNEILNVCDRIYVMSNGEIRGHFEKSEATFENILKCSM